MGKSAKRRKKRPANPKPAASNHAALLLQQAIEHHQAGRLPEAEKNYQQILSSDPNHADANHLLGVLAYQVGQLEVAKALISKALVTDSRQPLFHLNLGNVLQDLGQVDEALSRYGQAIALNPNFPEAHNNMGNALSAAGKPESAISSFKKALAERPDYAEAHNNLGNALKELEQYESAIDHLNKAVKLNPSYAEAHFNLGRALFSNSQLDDAITSCKKAIALLPDFTDAYINLGVMQHKHGDLQECIATSRMAISLAPENPAAHGGLGNALRDTGLLDEALTSYCRVIEIKPNDEEAWGNVQQTLKSSIYNKGLRGRDDAILGEIFSRSSRSSYYFSLLEHYLDSFRPHEADDSFQAAIMTLPDRAAVSVDEVAPKNQSSKLFKQTVALFHFGRSGTGLMHSLIDNHPEISTLPSIYLSGYFNAGVWENLTEGGIKGLPERFADEFAVLFDAKSPKAVPGTQKEGLPNIGLKEGMTAVGDNRDEALKVDREAFCDHARQLCSLYDRIDAGHFLQIVHTAYEKALERTSEKQTVFYHIHNPNPFTKFNFLRHTPDARLMMMIREPVQSCESWMRRAFENNEYTSMTFRIVTMLYDIDQVAFRNQDSIGVRLEDLKSQPQKTIQAICGWIGIEEEDTLFEMTAQGKKWWGDPSSPDYDDKKGMSAFDDTCVKRPSGAILGERDRLLLETLFYPFNVHFGYCEPDPAGFKRKLKEVHEIIGDLLDFEKDFINKTGAEIGQFQRRNNYQLLRAALTDRFEVLDEFGTYPHMLPKLSLD